MEYQIPRIMIAGTGSGCGKTTVTCAVLAALYKRGLNVGAFKCGPDYIDPMFHKHILGTPSSNLDSFFFDSNTINWLLVKNGSDKEICVIEGVMGYYDGAGCNSTKASSHEISQITHTPVILVLNAKGAALSLLAVIQGFLTFFPENNICGLILNQCTDMTYSILAEAVNSRFGGSIKMLGYLPPMPECSLESRHLGLITAQEVSDLDRKITILGEQAEKTIDLDGLIKLSARTVNLSCDPVSVPSFPEPVRIAVAKDNAFCFYYHDNLNILSEMGAEIVPFSPLSDILLPENIHGIYLGGGYPELYAEKLSKNYSMKRGILQALESGIPCIAECGGFMYLTDSIEDLPMISYLPGKCYNTHKLTRFGYIHLKADRDNMLCSKDEKFPAHEFHYWDCEATGTDFTAEKLSGKHWKCIYANDHLNAGYPHFHFYAKPELAINFYKACLRFKEKQNV